MTYFEKKILHSFPTSRDFSCLPITFENNLDPESLFEKVH